MDFLKYSKELEQHQKAITTLQINFLKDISRRLFDKLSEFNPDCVWFTFEPNNSIIKDISVNNASGKPIIHVPVDHPEILTGVYRHEFTTLMSGFGRKLVAISKDILND